MSAVERARGVLARRRPNEAVVAYLGTTGGDHIFRTKTGKIFAVDLVLGTAHLCVGLMPWQWKHPPKLPPELRQKKDRASA